MESKPFRDKTLYKTCRVSNSSLVLWRLCYFSYSFFIFRYDFVWVYYSWKKRRRVNQVPDKIDCGFKKSRAAALFCYKIHSNKKYGFVYIKPQDWWYLNHFFEIKTRRTVNQRQSRIISPEKREEKKIVDQL